MRHHRALRKGSRALAAAGDRREARGRLELGGAVDRRHEQVQLGAIGLAGERDADRMEQATALLSGAIAHALGGSPEGLAIEEPAGCCEILRQRTHDAARGVRGELGPHLLARERRGDVPAEHQAQPVGGLVERDPPHRSPSA